MPLRAAALTLAGLAVFAGVCFPLTNTDIWWQLAAGRWMVAHGVPLSTDPFSADVLGQRWVDVHWLFQLMVYGLHRLGGPALLVLAKSTLTAIAALVLLAAVSRAVTAGRGRATRLAPWELVVAGALVAAPLYIARYLVLARPIVITLLCASCVLLVLERYRAPGARRGRRRLLLWLLPVQLLWANTQGLFLLGPALVGCYLFGDALGLGLRRVGLWPDQDRPGDDPPALGGRELAWLALAIPALVLASLCSPQGLDNLLLPLRLFGRIDPVGSALFSENVSENVPTWLLERLHPGRVGYFKWVAAATFGSFLLRQRRPPLPRLVTLAAMFVLALMANRNVLLFCWLAGGAAAANLLEHLDERAPALRWRQALLAAGALLLALLPIHRLALAGDSLDLRRPAPFRAPEAAARRLAPLPPGKVFCSVRYGGYLTWASANHRHRPMIDGRLVLRSAAQFAEHLGVVDEPRRFFAFAERHEVRLALLPTAFPERYVGLVGAIYRHRDWRLLYTDGTQALFAHRELAPARAALDLGARATVARVVGELARAYAGQPRVLARARVHLGRLLAEAGELGRATEVLAGIPTDHRTLLADGLRARVHYLAGRRERARALCHRLLARAPEHTDSLVLLALLDADARRYSQSLGWARRALASAPHDRQAQAVLLRVKRAQRAGGE